MKNTIAKFFTAFLLLVLTSGCAKFTEIDPKGTNMLQKVSDLDMLLNHRFYSDIYENANAVYLMNDMQRRAIAYTMINEPEVAPVASAIFTWDASIDRAAVTETDAVYTGLYSVIGKICNPVLLRADQAEGDRALADRLKAEAYILRVWHHYILVNMYAKAYDPATAAEEGGIPYSRETDQPSVPNLKSSVQEVYDFMLEDLEAAFALNSFAAPSSNRMRVNSAFAHAVKAKVLMSMRDYEGAYQAATAALAIENTVDDYNTMITYTAQRYSSSIIPGYSLSRPEMSSREDLFYAEYVYLLLLGIPSEFAASFEPGNIFYHHTDRLAYGSSFGVNIDAWFDQNVYMNCGGLSTVDMYLLQAECLIRRGDATNINNAMDIINMIRRHRVATDVYATTTAANDTPDKIDPAHFYTPYTASTQANAITYLKQMVRAECWYGSKRFMDVKRWNTETAWQEVFHKHVDAIYGTGTVGYDFTLTPDSPLWVFPFPSKSTGLNANLTQNY